ncbi:MAG: hypothetical protein AB8B61_02870 [Cyclobacteriaceae bacterium]
MAKKSKKKVEEQKPKVHEDLDGLDVGVNSFGEVQTSISIDKINEFLNKNVEDKKLSNREEEGKEKKKKK